MPRLQGKTSIVTGGGSGIGKATAIRFAQEGANVAIFESNRETGAEIAATLQAQGSAAEFHHVDVSDESSVKAGVAAVLRRWITIDVLVNNAAIVGANKGAHELTVAEWDQVFAVNVRGTFLCTREVLPTMMAARNGSIINFSSVYGLVGNDDQPPYHATKGAILMMTKTDAMCYGRYGIRVNAVHPGPTKTELLMKVAEVSPKGRDTFLDDLAAMQVLGLSEPVDIANCVLFLASDESRCVTGTGLVCDGGYTAH